MAGAAVVDFDGKPHLLVPFTSNTEDASNALATLSAGDRDAAILDAVAFAFSSTRSAVSHEASKFSGKDPGPEHGCFSRNGADSEYEGHYSKQVLDCISQLDP